MLDSRVSIIKEVPFFKEISKTALMKYSHFFNAMDFTRNQVVMKEGGPFELMHLIVEGEFELSKQIEYLDPDIARPKRVDLKEFLP